MQGTLIIKPMSANLKRDTDFLSRMDPYVIVKVGGQVKKTGVAYEAGKHPGWRDEMSFRLNNEDVITFEVLDKDTFTKDDMVGSASLAFSSVQKRGGVMNEWLTLTYKGRDAGSLLVDIRFHPDGYGCKPGMNMINTPYVVQTGMPGMVQPQTYPMVGQQQQIGFQQPIYTQQIPQQTIPQPVYQQTIPQQTIQQPIYQQTIPQPVYQQTIPQQTSPLQQIYPQQQVYPQPVMTQAPLKKHVTYAPPIEQCDYVQQGGYKHPGQIVQGYYPQQGYQQGPYQQGFHY